MAQQTRTGNKRRRTSPGRRQKAAERLEFVQDYIPIKELRNGIIETTDGRFIKILEIEPIIFCSALMKSNGVSSPPLPAGSRFPPCACSSNRSPARRIPTGTWPDWRQISNGTRCRLVVNWAGAPSIHPGGG
mgnify:CR=1 FL=1